MSVDLVHKARSKEIVRAVMDVAGNVNMDTEWFPKSLRAYEYPFVIDALSDLPRPKSRILDVGVYLSPFPHYLARMGHQVTAIDTNRALLKYWIYYSLRLRSGVKYRLRDAEATRFPDESFDAVTSISVLEHMAQPERSVREAARLLRPGGLFILTCDMVIPGHGMDCPHNAFTAADVVRIMEEVPELQPRGEYEFDENVGLDMFQWMSGTLDWHRYIGGAGVFVKR